MTDTDALLARLVVLETRVAHQDRAIDDLNDTITAQWKEIEKLTRQITRMNDQMQELRDRAPDGPEPPPPHY